jgi:aminoglycoside phosphotransferase family enzyme
MRLPLHHQITLESKLAFLRQAHSFPDPTNAVEAIETHMSWVFLTDAFAYKLKKPVCYDFLDFRTLAARRFYCSEELRLNRRLAAGVYLDVIALTVSADGQLQIGGDGAPVDFLVKMQRLPSHHMLDHALKEGSACAGDSVRLATLLAHFYQGLPAVSIGMAEYRARLLQNITKNANTLCKPAYGLPIDWVQSICAAQTALVLRNPDLFDQRIRAGRIVEGHGDLRPEHVCLWPQMAIIDCLEFSLVMRQADSADELAFLTLECERLGNAAFGTALLKAYTTISGDVLDPALVHFYQSYRACRRAMLAIRHLDETQFRASSEWSRRTLHYLQMAQQRIQGFQ